MPGINQATILGNVGKDPEIKSLSWGRVANLSIATSEKWRDKQTGDLKERTQWHNIVVKNDGLVGVIEKYVRKGDKLFVQGQIETRSWDDNNGGKKYTTEIVLGQFNSRLELLTSRGGDQGGGREERSSDDQRGRNVNDSGRGYSQPVDDEIPF